nr:putative gustatory receptor 2a [Aedes albopictus]
MCEEQQNILKQLKLIMDKLDSTVQLTNRSVSIQVLYCVGVSFVIGIVCSFYLFRAVIYRNDQLVMGVVNFVWYMYYISFVLFFIAIGSRISHEGQRIGITVHKAINFCNTSRTVINELIIFSQQLLHHKPVITCGLFVYDWSLLYTMLGATATYLIILIQFDVSFPSLDAIGNLTSQE